MEAQLCPPCRAATLASFTPAVGSGMSKEGNDVARGPAAPRSLQELADLDLWPRLSSPTAQLDRRVSALWR